MTAPAHAPDGRWARHASTFVRPELDSFSRPDMVLDVLMPRFVEWMSAIGFFLRPCLGLQAARGGYDQGRALAELLAEFWR